MKIGGDYESGDWYFAVANANAKVGFDPKTIIGGSIGEQLIQVVANKDILDIEIFGLRYMVALR